MHSPVVPPKQGSPTSGSAVSRSASVLSMYRSQSLSIPSQISTPPLVGVHSYSQPFSGAPSTSTQPASHTWILQNVLTSSWHGAPAAVLESQTGVACGVTQVWPHSP